MKYFYTIVGWKENMIPVILERTNNAQSAEEIRENAIKNKLVDGIVDVTVESGDFNPDQWT